MTSDWLRHCDKPIRPIPTAVGHTPQLCSTWKKVLKQPEVYKAAVNLAKRGQVLLSSSAFLIEVWLFGI